MLKVKLVFSTANALILFPQPNIRIFASTTTQYAYSQHFLTAFILNGVQHVYSQ